LLLLLLLLIVVFWVAMEPSSNSAPAPLRTDGDEESCRSRGTNHSADSGGKSRWAEGWPQFWAVVLLGATAETVSGLVLPGLATAYFNGGTDPCIGDAHSSAACQASVAKSLSVASSFGLLSSVLAFFGSPIVGSLCDAVGRKPLLIANSFMVFVHVSSLLAVEMFDFSLYIYFWLGIALGAMSGTVMFGLWIADKTSPAHRLALFAALAAAMDVEGIMMPLFGAFVRTRACLIIAVVLSLACLVLTISLPESAPREQRQAFTWNQTARLGGIFAIFKDKRYRTLSLLVLIGNTVHAGCASIFLLYMKEQFGATLQMVGPIMFINGVSALLVQLFVVQRLGNCLGLRKLILVGYAFGALNCVIISLAPNFQFLYLIAPIGGLGIICSPAIQALYMNMAEPEQRGQIQGSLTALLTLTGGLGPVVYSAILVLFSKPIFGMDLMFAPYLLTICMNIVGSCIVLRLPSDGFQDSSETCELQTGDCANS